MEEQEVTAPMFTEPQMIALAITPVVTSFFSFVGSSLITYIIVKTRNSPRRKKQKTYYHLVLAMSLSDVIASLSFVTGPFLEPQGSHKWQAHGTQATCNLQGFLTQIGFMSPFYTTFLAMYFYLCICHHKNRNARASIQMEKIQRIEPYVMALPFLMNLSFAITSLALDLYNPTEFGVGCWIGPMPYDCEEDGASDCVRGKHSSLFRILFGAMWIIPFFLVLLYCFGSIYWSLRKQLQEHEQHFTSELGLRLNAARNDLRQTGIQGLLYILAFVAVYFWNFVARGMEMLRAKNGYFAISLLSQIFSPSQGFFNFFIFVRPIYCEFQRHHPQASSSEIWARVFGKKDQLPRRGQRSSSSSNKTVQPSNGSTPHFSVETPGGNPNSQQQQQQQQQQPSIDLCLDHASEASVPARVLDGHGSTDTLKMTGDSEEQQMENQHETEEGLLNSEKEDDLADRECELRPYSIELK